MLSSVTSTYRPKFAIGADPCSLKASLRDLFAHQPVQKVAAGEAAFWEADPASHVTLVVEGCLRLTRILPDGRRAIVGFAFEGELLGLSSLRAYAYTAEAVTPVRLRQLKKRYFHAAADQTAALRSQLLDEICNETLVARRHMILLGRLNAEEKVASFILSIARPIGAAHGDLVTAYLPMLRLDIADYLGLTIETVCRVLSRFKRAGIIEFRERNRLVLRRLGKLRELAGWDQGDEIVPSLMPFQRASLMH